MSQAYSDHKLFERGKAAMSEYEKSRLMGAHLNGCGCERRGDSLWEDYFKPAFDKRKQEYLTHITDPNIPFVCDVNWPINSSTGWFRTPGNITKTVIDSNTVEISWTTPELADSLLTWTNTVDNGVWWYYQDSGGWWHGPDGTDSSSTKTYNHTLTMTNLVANKTYEFRIRSTNDTNNPPNLSTQIIWGYVGTYP